MRKYGIVTVAAAILVFTGFSVQQKALKLGYVDRVKVLSQLEKWQAADAELAQLQQAAQLEVQSVLIEADSLNKMLEGQLMLTPAKRTELQERINQLSISYQRLQVTKQQELLARESELKTPILNDFEEIVSKIGIDEDYLFIYDKAANAVIFAAGGRDVTEQVLFDMRKLYK